jgi:hypothetical protein
MRLIDKILQDAFLKTSSIVLDLTSFPVLEDENEYHRRLDVCKGCDKLNNLKICGECWCYMPAKAALLQNSCPLGKH